MSAEHALSPREEWLLLLWMAQHPRAVWEDTTLSHPRAPGRRAPRAYALGVVVGTLWLVVRRWW